MCPAIRLAMLEPRPSGRSLHIEEDNHMFQRHILKGLILTLFVVITFVPGDLASQDACMAPWETGSLESYQRAELQAQGQLLVDCEDPCEQYVADALASYERAVLQASGQVLTDVSDATQERFARAEMQAQGQVMIEPNTLACSGDDSAVS